ncbi:uncharacterized protein [Oryza sativa Japonica Group]|uniref:uncharacterized protein n=1 Tax=Oryza sativa subsp. japonica TaxID=39947 RepID=UPI00339CD981
MTDKQKGLIPAVQQIFPDSEHRFCVRHLYSNFQVHFKGENLKNQLWACARSSSEVEWNANMEEMKSLNQDAYEWLQKMPPKTWVKAYFSEFPKCDILLNNNCEVFNKYILEARELPILSMFEKIKSQLISRHYSKQKEVAEQWHGPICPKIRKKVLKNADMANTCYVLPAGKGIFQVEDRNFKYIVDLSAKHCDCRRWDLTGIPCNHAISCLRSERISAESILPPCYSLEAFSRAYAFNIWPYNDMTKWVQVNGPEVKPPIYEKKVGRPPKSRRKAPHEVQGKNGPKMSKHGVEMHCSFCKEPRHNKKGCPLRKARLRPKLKTSRIPAASSTKEWHESKQEPAEMFEESSQVSQMETTHGPLPDNQYILSNQPAVVSTPMTTATKEGKSRANKRKCTTEGVSGVAATTSKNRAPRKKATATNK